MTTQTKSAKQPAKRSTARRTKLRRPLSETVASAAPLDPQNLAAMRLLASWDEASEEEIQEQRETWAFLERALDIDRLSPHRKFFAKS